MTLYDLLNEGSAALLSRQGIPTAKTMQSCFSLRPFIWIWSIF